MGYNQLINSNIDRTFRLLKDLAVSVTFNQKAGSSFNFGTGDVEHSSSSAVVTKVVVLEGKKNSKTHSTKVKYLLVKKKDVASLSGYDTVVMTDGTWNVGALVRETFNILMVEIRTEGANG